MKMKRMTVLGFVCATVFLGASALATPTPQQRCDYARITAWKVYTSCIDAVAAKAAKGVSFDWMAPFAQCRHTYFKKWPAFQSKPALAGSTCIGSRYTDNGDQTVTDKLSGLTWEKKDKAGGIHDPSAYSYNWCIGSSWRENGSLFTTFLATLNSDGFGGANGWRIPTLPELQTIVLDFPCKGTFGGPGCACPSKPCVDPTLDASNTPFDFPYWTATKYLASDDYSIWDVGFDDGGVGYDICASSSDYFRAVRGGL